MDNLELSAKKLTNRELVSQLIMRSIEGRELSNSILESAKKYPWGGYILFASNLKEESEVKRLIAELKNLPSPTSASPFIGADHEGGIVTRFTFDSITPLSGNMALAASGEVENCAIEYEISGREMRQLGLNLNFAPVSDVNSNPKNPIIGARSFGDDPKKVALFCKKAIEGLQHGGVLACSKHFPGHGATDTDSHLKMPVINKSEAELESCELIPFKGAIEAGTDMIMTSHILFREADPIYPATLSQKILKGILRKKLGYDGVIITDSLSMRGIIDSFGLNEAAILAFHAGNDIVMLCGTQNEIESATEAVISDLEKSPELRRELEKSWCRTMRLREKADKMELKPPDSNRRELVHEIGRRAIVLCRDENKLLPIGKKSRVIIAPSHLPPSPQGEAVIVPNCEPLDRGCSLLNINFDPNSSELPTELNYENLDKLDPDIFIFLIYSGNKLSEKYVKICEFMRRYSQKTVVISLNSPYIMKQLPDFGTFLATFSPSAIILEAAGELLAGEIPFRGKLPVKIL